MWVGLKAQFNSVFFRSNREQFKEIDSNYQHLCYINRIVKIISKNVFRLIF